jgi:hypothetical protein
MEILPNELVLHIVKYLPKIDEQSFRATCKRMSILIDPNRIIYSKVLSALYCACSIKHRFRYAPRDQKYITHIPELFGTLSRAKEFAETTFLQQPRIQLIIDEENFHGVPILTYKEFDTMLLIHFFEIVDKTVKNLYHKEEDDIDDVWLRRFKVHTFKQTLTIRMKFCKF